MPKVPRAKVPPRQLIDGQDEFDVSEESRTILTNAHRISIAQFIVENKVIIKGHSKGNNIKAEKNRVWREIYDHAYML